MKTMAREMGEIAQETEEIARAMEAAREKEQAASRR